MRLLEIAQVPSEHVEEFKSGASAVVNPGWTFANIPHSP